MLSVSALALAFAPSLIQAQEVESVVLKNTTSNQVHALVTKALRWNSQRGLPSFAKDVSWTATEAEEAGYWIVQGKPGELKPLRDALLKWDCKVFDYVPNHAFTVRVPKARLAQVRGLAKFLMPIQPAMKLDPELGLYATALEDPYQRMLVSAEYWPDADPVALQERFEEYGFEIESVSQSGRFVRAQLRLHPGDLVALARIPGVQWIQESAPVVLRNNRARWIVQTNQLHDYKLWKKGVTGAGITVGHIDGRIYEDTCFFDDPTGVAPGPTHRKIKWMSQGFGSDPHGTHTAGSIAGDGRAKNKGLSHSGVAPDAYLVHHSYFPNSSNLLSMFEEAYSHGARIHSNSWGNDFTRSYDNWCRDIDAYSHDHEDALVVFAVSNGVNIKNPENAKSSLSVSATESNNPDEYYGGGHGPTDDGRLKPELLAPGADIDSAAAGAKCLTIKFSGTSMAAPMVAGGAALLKQYFEDGYWPTGVANAADGFTPTGSLLRAALVHSGKDMSTLAGYPNYTEGWGRILLDTVTYFDGDQRKLRLVDTRHSQGLIAGSVQTHQVHVSASRHLRVTLAWADEPGAAMSATPLVNDLDLVLISPNGTRYHGNIFKSGAQHPTSRANPPTHVTDQLNTLETIMVNHAMPGRWTVEVRGANVPVGPQGYAIVASF
ncbi:MAG: S8 family serine peptidase [Planctomycetes bacterium]|jgi:hypothetical protein|nr:S8 family serine peptidase [Planctomycetota bacterium]MBT4029318.1 S8 family serine peptidase [Planctomycetota bacterium]MBT4561303.1 S8 family serine peptidase [Planctomycetota bacterium]MBT5101395.1 S8 family serine peptidase [Planctomycetota bacterium]MBT7012641.1 S8 family serine peptidase [Planctomycetota bacterium]